MYFKNVILARNRVAPWGWSKKIETCWSNFKCFNVKKFYVCALVGVLIKLFYEMHGATMKIKKKKLVICSRLLWQTVGSYQLSYTRRYSHCNFVVGMWVCVTLGAQTVLWHQNSNVLLAEEHKTLLILRKICRCISVRFRTMVPTHFVTWLVYVTCILFTACEYYFRMTNQKVRSHARQYAMTSTYTC